MKELLQSTLKNATWPEPRERDKVKAWIKEIGERVKKRMLGACSMRLDFAVRQHPLLTYAATALVPPHPPWIPQM